MYSHHGCQSCLHKDQLIASLYGQVEELKARLAGYEGGQRPPHQIHAGVAAPAMHHPQHPQHQAPCLPPQAMAGAGTGRAAFPFPQHVQYAQGSIKPNHCSQEQLDKDVRAFYDYWKQKYLKEAGIAQTTGKMRYRVIMNNNGNATVSEGQGFGMMIVALMAGHEQQAQQIVDGLYTFCKDYPSNINARNMAWKVNADGSRGGENSAFDGDADIIYGLILADRQWGSQGDINYRQEALAKLEAMAVSMIGPDSKLPLLGDWVQPRSDDKFCQWSARSSDFMYGHLKVFAHFDQQRRQLWESVLSATQSVADQVQRSSGNTGLLPDFIQYDRGSSSYRPASAGFLEGNNDGSYFYNAGRIPWRFGASALLHGDAVAGQQIERMLRWVLSQNSIKAGYHLDGRPIGDYSSTFFVSPFAVAAMIVPSAQSWLNTTYDSIKNKQENYYEDCVNLLCLLTISGNFWDPVTVGTGYAPPAIALSQPISVAKPIVMPAATSSTSTSSASSGGQIVVRGSRGTSFTFLSGSNKWWLGVSIPASNSVQIDDGSGKGLKDMAHGWAPGIFTHQCQGSPCGSSLRFVIDGRQEETVPCPY